ncbi:unnamed protein product [Larinioides sclopetarius]|uniref:Uncharacterized protein n=1 Tax=Larinioides sclopetarius TaxID=280406 RepID=A0AAV1ZM74_9ARAC
MIIRHHGGLELFAIIWMFMTLVAGSQNGTETTTSTSLASNITEITITNNFTVTEDTTKLPDPIVLEDNITSPENIEKYVKSQRRAPRYDTADSVPWVRFYNRPPGVKTESYFKYDTRSNTSAHTSGEVWDSFRKDKTNDVAPINRRESKTRVQDLLRVKSKVTTAPSPKRQDTAETDTSTNAPETTTNPPVQTSTAAAPVKNDTLNKGYIIWSSNDGVPSSGWTFGDQKGKPEKEQPSVDDLMPKDGTKWKVLGDGGEDGWQVVDDKGDVEWKIEYDDGEWRVTSTGDIPVDAEWVDPEYVWGPDGSLSEEDEYNSWSAEDYAYSPWVDPVVYVRGVGNHTWPKSDGENQVAKSSIQTYTSGEKKSSPESNFLSPKDPFVFGARRKIPGKDSSSAQDRTTDVKSDSADDSLSKSTETPQADQVVAKGKSWVSSGPTIKTGQKWVQGYGVKSWEVDNTGKNSGFGGETWITANKDFPNTPWVPKSATGSVQDTPKPEIPAIQPIVPQDAKTLDNPIRAWGTGYGSKTWKGNEWDSNVVWKTGFGGALPWTTENNTSWKFPDESNDDAKAKDKKTIVWSQPLPSEESEPTSSPKPTTPPAKSLNNIRIKWPTKPPIGGNFKWKAPPRRAEDESWGDDSSEGGVIWKDQVTEPAPTDAPIDLSTKIIGHLNKGWQTGGWATNQNVPARPITFSWKGNPPPKTSDLISVNWKSDEIVTDAPPAPSPAPVAWNQGIQGQWPVGEPVNFPTWIFGGCKLTIKCGSTESDSSEDESLPTTPQDTSEDDSSSTATDAPTTTTGFKGWPVNQFKGKSWRPPTKSWRPPTKSWRPPKKGGRPSTPNQPPPTMPDTPPPTPPMSWKKPAPPPKTMWKKPPPGWKQPPPGWKQPPPGWKQPPPSWKQPPPSWKQPPPSWKQPPTTPATTIPWTEATTSAPPSMSWKSPPPPPPPSMKWKKPGPRPGKSWKPPPTKSWKPPPTKSWRPPTYPGKSWQPPIATPAPDTWSTPPKPDCKDTSEPTQETPAPNNEDEDEEISPPQIIIITKLPNNQKGTLPPTTDKWDTRDDRKNKKPPAGKSWSFPSRKVSQKANKNQKEMVGRMVNKWPAKPRKMSKPANKFKGWPKGMPMPNFTWPANSMRRWTTKRPSYMNTWKPPKYMRSKAWKQMLKKWMKARM